MQVEINKYPGDAKFQKLLKRTSCVLDIYSIRAMVSGYVWGLEYVSPSFAIQQVPFEGFEDDEIDPQSEADEFEFMECFFSLWNSFATNNTKKVRKIRPLPKDFADVDQVMNGLYNLANDMGVFLDAMDDTNSEDLLNTDEFSLLMVILEVRTTLGRVDDFLNKINNQDGLSQSQFRDAVNLFCISRHQWSESYHILGQQLVKIRKKMEKVPDEAFLKESPFKSSDPTEIVDEILLNTQPANSEPKINRNDSYPCGSGKKHKKCCMLQVVH